MAGATHREGTGSLGNSADGRRLSRVSERASQSGLDQARSPAGRGRVSRTPGRGTGTEKAKKGDRQATWGDRGPALQVGLGDQGRGQAGVLG